MTFLRAALLATAHCNLCSRIPPIRITCWEYVETAAGGTFWRGSVATNLEPLYACRNGKLSEQRRLAEAASPKTSGRKESDQRSAVEKRELLEDVLSTAGAVLPPISRRFSLVHLSSPISGWVAIGIGASGPRLLGAAVQHRQHSCSRSASRRTTACHGFHDSSR
jgi:hypothetical protein